MWNWIVVRRILDKCQSNEEFSSVYFGAFPLNFGFEEVIQIIYHCLVQREEYFSFLCFQDS